MSALLLACMALCAAIAAMPEASTGVRADAEPLVAAQGTLIKYAGGPFNTAFISARPGAQHSRPPAQWLAPSVTGLESPARSVVRQSRAPHGLEAAQGGPGRTQWGPGKSSFTSMGGTWSWWAG
jgi:hypothetical protein